MKTFTVNEVYGVINGGENLALEYTPLSVRMLESEICAYIRNLATFLKD